MLLVALAAPLVAYAVYEWTQKREIDEHKLIPLFLGVGSYGILMVGLIDWGTAQGGYFGVTEGDYAFQNAEMNVLWQAIGLAVCIAAGLATGWVIAAIFKARGGLAVTEDVQVAGYDARYWEIVHDLEPVDGSAVALQAPAAAVDAPGDGVDAGELGARRPGEPV
jgi:Amt family ammonium transporter